MLNLLPEEILAEILSRLPVKSLARVKCVCKLCLSLISDPFFSEILQQKLASRDPKILISSSSGFQSFDCSATSFTDEVAFVNLDFPLHENIVSDISIVGSCNGLVCIALNHCRDFFLWNPTTGICKKLPDPFPNNSLEEHIILWGFGYDSSINDYKILLCVHSTYSRSGSQLRILATKSDSWREIKNKHNCSIQCCDVYCWPLTQGRPRGSLLNGTLHWITKSLCRHAQSLAISAFDLAEEKFSEMPMPNVGGLKVLNDYLTLSILDGCLCVFSSNLLELRMLKEYGVQSSWEKLFRVAENFHEYWLLPLCFTTRGGAEFIMLNNWEELIRFRPKEGILERLMINGRPRTAEAIAYTESFLYDNI